MKTYFSKISFVFLFFSSIILNGQVDPDRNNYIELQNSMTDPSQSEYNLLGFEGRAVQKTQDFADYLEIISNKEYDLSLRKHTASLALKLFYDNAANIDNADIHLSNLKVLSLEDYVDNYINTKYTKIVVDMTNFKYTENLRSNESNAYSGKLKFDQTNKYYNAENLSDESTEHKEVEIILVKTTKEFGKNRKDVWSVLLGNIKTVK